jgi:arabinan endo-1,5-alpha-L-arabinosidase
MAVQQRSLRQIGAVASGLLLSAAVVAGSGVEGPKASKTNHLQRDSQWLAPEFVDASVHDPSVLRVDGTYYVFGSHLAAAKSPDLLQWEKIADGVHPANPLFDDVFAELEEAFDWANTDTLWAADVIQLADGKFYMYYNACQGDAPRSAMGVAVADNVEGPYVNQGIFLRSGMWGEESEDGTVYDARVHPNAIDPDTFFDAEGRLWMIYGSYSGGMFIMEMNPETGMPLPDQGYGEHLMGGNHSRIEGAYVLYSPDTHYYYMFTTFGGLDAAGGYNMRVARSLRPDGPYFDAMGNNMADVKSDPSLPIFDDRTIEPFAQKLMGNFLFDRKLGESGEGMGTGYVSPGHNSAYYDPETDKYFLLFHTRFPGRGEMHQIRVHEMFMNEDSWPVVAPYRYAPRVLEGESVLTNNTSCRAPGKCATETIARHEVPGDYKYINHGKAITADIVNSQPIRLAVNGDIRGAVSGQWQFNGHNRLSLDIGGSTYEGVLSRQWNETAQRFTVTFSAQSQDGVSVWGSQLADKPASEVIADILAELSQRNGEEVIDDIDLPTTATRGATVAWASSHPEFLVPDGSVTRPEHGEGDRKVTLTATVQYDGLSETGAVDFVVQEKAPNGLLAHYSFDGNLADATGQKSAGYVSGPRIDTFGGNIGYTPGVAGDAAVFDGNSGVRLPDGLIAGNTYSVSFWLNPSALTPFTTTFFGARAPDSWISFLPVGHGFINGHTMLWSGTAWYDAGTGMNIPANAWSHIVFTVNQGQLKVYIDGIERFAGSNFPHVFTSNNGVFSLGVNWWDIPYSGLMDELRVYERELTAQDAAFLSGAP